MIPLVIFGTGTIARLAAWYFQKDSSYSLQAFCVDDIYWQNRKFNDMPVLAAGSLAEQWPPGSCHLFIALGYQRQNTIRQKKFEMYLDAGYEIASCISPHALIMNDNNYGKNCFIMEGAILQPFAKMGDNCICWSGAIVAHESTVGNNCFLAANCTVGGAAAIGDNTFLGMNSCVRNEVKVGAFCVLGAGCIARQDLHDDAFVVSSETVVSKIPASKAMRFLDI